MSFFRAMFGLDSTSVSSAYKQLSNDDIERIVSRSHMRSVTEKEKKAIITILRAARDSRGRTSLQKINEKLMVAVHKGDISDIDKAAVMKRCTSYFEK